MSVELKLPLGQKSGSYWAPVEAGTYRIYHIRKIGRAHV